MDNFFLYFKDKISLSDENLYQIRNIILNDNITFVKETFSTFISNKQNPLNDTTFFYCSIFLYCLDIRREFKKKLLTIISSKFDSSTSITNHVTTFLSYIDLTLLSTSNINDLKYKFLLLNNFFDLSIKYLTNIKKEKSKIDEVNNTIYDLSNIFFCYYISSFEKKEFSLLIKNTNDEIGMILTFYVNSFMSIINTVYNRIKYDFEDTIKIIENDLINIPINYTIKTKDLLFIYSNLYFNLLGRKLGGDEKLLMKKADEIFDKCLNNTKSYEIIFSYIKGLYNNFIINNSIDFFIKEKILILNKFIKEKIILLDNDKNIYKNDLSLADFYIYFLEHDTNGKYSLIINDIILLILVKIINTKNAKLKDELISHIKNNKFIDLIINKIDREKKNFSFIEDNFFDILTVIYNKTNEELNKYISSQVNLYLINIINSKKRPLTNECVLFTYIKNDIKNNINNTKNTLNDFMKLIMSFPYEKKDISLIMENSKIYFEFYGGDKNLKEFYQIFPEQFVGYLRRVPIQYLKNLNTLYLQLSKLNFNLYFLIVNYCYDMISQLNQQGITNQDKYISIYGVLFSLLRPIRLQKKSLDLIKGKIQIFNLKLEKEIILDLNLISYLVLSTNEYLTLEIVEFINELDDKNQIFKIIFKIIKYSIKNQNQEYKGGIAKSLQIFFSQYFTQITKLMNKFDTKLLNEEKKYLDIALNQNIIKLCKYLSDSIYDRPVENLLPYLDLFKLIINLIDSNLYNNAKLYNTFEIYKNFINEYEKIVFEKGLCLSLISLLKHSYSFIRMNAFNILSNEKYTPIITQLKDEIIKEIKKYLYSLRQMDNEGSSYLFVLYLIHNNINNKSTNDETINDIYLNIFDYDLKNIDKTKKEQFYCKSGILRIIEIMLYIIKERKDEYLNLIKNNSKTFDIKKYSIHSFFTFMRNILDLQKHLFTFKNENIYSEIKILFELISYIITLNTEFLEFLINNGVSEYTLEEGEDQIYDENNTNINHENTLMISLWNTSKYSLGTLSTILDIFSQNYPNLTSYINQNKSIGIDFKDIFLDPLKNNFEKIVPIIVNAKHMGVVRAMSDCLYKISITLNKSELNLICREKIENFVEKELPNHVVSSTLRRSAGIPFLMTTLIRSYITENYSYNFIKNILKKTIDNLLNNFNKYQDTHMDASVHCLHIIRVICDDTIIKPFVKEFYDNIIMNIIKGLQNKNWSIKNACMLMFSRIITNNFLLQNEVEMQRTLLTFKEYFYDKNTFYEIIIDTLSKYINDTKINESLLLFITFFTKLRQTKPNEYQDDKLLKIIKLLFQFDKKDNKLFRKLLTSAIFKLYGNNYPLLIKDIKEKINVIINQNSEVKLVEINNQIDFYYNLINEIIKLSNDSTINDNIKLEMVYLFKKLILIVLKEDKNIINTYFGLSKYIQLIKKLNNIKDFLNENLLLKDIKYDFGASLGVDGGNNNIDLNILFNTLIHNSRVFNFCKFIKHILNLYLEKLNYSLKDIDLVKYFQNKKLEEIIVLLFTKYSSKLNYSFISSIFNPNDIENLSKFNVNISSELVLFIEKNIQNKKFILTKENKSLLLNKIISILKKEKEKTKLVTKLFSLIPLLISDYTNDTKEIYLNELYSILNLIYIYIHSDNLEKLRIEGLLTLYKIIILLYKLNKLKINILENNYELNLLTFKIIFLLLNDEKANIRNKASEIFYIYNEMTNIISFKNNNIYFVNDFLCQKILSKIDLKKECNRKLALYILDNDIYFKQNVLENKVFYFEPDNNYIDNAKNKILILENVLKNKMNCLIEEKFESEKIEDDVLQGLEEFTQKVSGICKELIKKSNDDVYKEFDIKEEDRNKYIFKDIIRKKIYKV